MCWAGSRAVPAVLLTEVPFKVIYTNPTNYAGAKMCNKENLKHHCSAQMSLAWIQRCIKACFTSQMAASRMKEKPSDTPDTYSNTVHKKNIITAFQSSQLENKLILTITKNIYKIQNMPLGIKFHATKVTWLIIGLTENWFQISQMSQRAWL